MPRRDIIAVGASAGGVAALEKLLSRVPADLPAAILITEHLFDFKSMLVEVLSRKACLPVSFARHGQALERGHVYVAPPDHHLLLRNGSMELGRGPREGMQRPSINAMFRSAAAAYGDRVIGVVLTGLLDDGAAGLFEIRQRGGLAVVQNPSDAEYPSMPRAALTGVAVDHVVTLEEMPALLTTLTKEGSPRRPLQEAVIMADELVNQSCPECGGALTKTRLGDFEEYRCHVGHRLGRLSMIEAKRALHERLLLGGLAQAEELVALIDATDEEARSEIEGHERVIAALRQLLGLPAKASGDSHL